MLAGGTGITPMFQVGLYHTCNAPLGEAGRGGSTAGGLKAVVSSFPYTGGRAAASDGPFLCSSFSQFLHAKRQKPVPRICVATLRTGNALPSQSGQRPWQLCAMAPTFKGTVVVSSQLPTGDGRSILRGRL